MGNHVGVNKLSYVHDGAQDLWSCRRFSRSIRTGEDNSLGRMVGLAIHQIGVARSLAARQDSRQAKVPACIGLSSTRGVRRLAANPSPFIAENRHEVAVDRPICRFDAIWNYRDIHLAHRRRRRSCWPTSAPTPTTASSKGIYCYKFDLASGKLTSVGSDRRH